MTQKSSLILASTLLASFALVTPLTRARARVNDASQVVPAASTATPTRAPEALSWQKATEGTFRLRQLVITRRLEERIPFETAEEGEHIVADGKRVFAYLVAFNKGKARRLEVIWRHGDQVYHQQALAVGRAPSWRTWAYVEARPRLTGDWTVTVLDERGAELASRRFRLIAAE